jgi:hypothetical protein
VGDSSADQTEPLCWRVPPAQSALLFLVVCGSAALNLYSRPAAEIRLVTIGLGLLALGAAICALRMYLVADDQGVGVRYLGRASWTAWSQIERVEVVSGVRGAHTVRLTRRDGSSVTVPPSLLQPTRPTSKPRALAQLKGIARDLETLRTHR